jgi:hypothetical protein
MKKKFFYGFSVVGALLILAFAYYALSPLFITVHLDEVLPAGLAESPSVSVQVVGTLGHMASGSARIIEADDKQYLRYENFQTTNGPDLYVYLANDLNAKEFVSLGLLRATEGNVNYEIPNHIRPTDYRYALVWCKRFGVLFNYADFFNTN